MSRQCGEPRNQLLGVEDTQLPVGAHEAGFLLLHCIESI